MSKTQIGFGCYDHESYDNREPLTIREAIDRHIQWDHIPYKLRVRFSFYCGVLVGVSIGVLVTGLVWMILD